MTEAPPSSGVRLASRNGPLRTSSDFDRSSEAASPFLVRWHLRAIEEGGSDVNDSNKRGFAAMDRERQLEISRKGGRAAHEQGKAHEFDHEEARAAGKKGGFASSRDRERMREIGRLGGLARHERARQRAETGGVEPHEQPA